MKKTLAILLLCTTALLGACADGGGGSSDDDDGSSSTNPESLAISFGLAASPATTAARAVSRQAAPALMIDGTNGTLALTRIAVIVDEFELEPVDVAECDVEPEPATCVDVEQHYFFIDVPVDGTPVTVVNADIPDGSYAELEIEVSDIEVDDDDPGEAEDADLIAALFAEVRNAYPNWPEEASMVVEGTFTPTGGDAVPFTTYFEAEIEVELEFPTPLVVPDDLADGIQVALYPEVWFTNPDGTVRDLSQLQNQVVEFELQLEDGFELEFDND